MKSFQVKYYDGEYDRYISVLAHELTATYFGDLLIIRADNVFFSVLGKSASSVEITINELG